MRLHTPCRCQASRDPAAQLLRRRDFAQSLGRCPQAPSLRAVQQPRRSAEWVDQCGQALLQPRHLIDADPGSASFRRYQHGQISVVAELVEIFAEKAVLAVVYQRAPAEPRQPILWQVPLRQLGVLCLAIYHRGVFSLARRSSTAALWPPNPKGVDNTIDTGSGRATSVMKSYSLNSGSSRLRMGGNRPCARAGWWCLKVSRARAR